MKTVYLKNVIKATRAPGYLGTGRSGTVMGCTLAQFEQQFGAPHTHILPGEADDKVSKIWYFTTPRGMVSVYDYWWNKPDELSIGAEMQNQTGWLVGYLRALGLDAFKGTQR